LRQGISVLLVDGAGDRVPLRRGLERSGGFRIVGEAASGREAMELSTTLQPDVIVLDLALPRLDGRATIDGIRRRAPASRILALAADRQTPAATARSNGPVAYIARRGGAAAISSALAALCGRN
jgi:DNA-binding NarL/FixJ family response regulator